MGASVVVGQPFASGPLKLLSGNPWSGQIPYGGVRVSLDRSASGTIFLGYSGNVTLSSGQLLLSGGAYSGMTDGFPINPGQSLLVPRSMLISGDYNLFVWHEVATSGQGRVYLDPIFGR